VLVKVRLDRLGRVAETIGAEIEVSQCPVWFSAEIERLDPDRCAWLVQLIPRMRLELRNRSETRPILPKVFFPADTHERS
jgi:hypothetical protein